MYLGLHIVGHLKKKGICPLAQKQFQKVTKPLTITIRLKNHLKKTGKIQFILDFVIRIKLKFTFIQNKDLNVS